MAIADKYLRRICTWPDLDGELELLSQARLISLDEGDGETPARWVVVEPTLQNVPCQLLDLRSFAKAQVINLSKILVTLNFTPLAGPSGESTGN